MGRSITLYPYSRHRALAHSARPLPTIAEPASAKYDKDAHKLAQGRLTALGADKVPGGK